MIHVIKVFFSSHDNILQVKVLKTSLKGPGKVLKSS